MGGQVHAITHVEKATRTPAEILDAIASYGADVEAALNKLRALTSAALADRHTNQWPPDRDALDEQAMRTLGTQYRPGPGQALAQRLVVGCIRDLQCMQDCLSSGDDSPLRSIWEEVCIQQQRELSFSWRAYQKTIAAGVEGRIGELKPYELDARGC